MSAAAWGRGEDVTSSWPFSNICQARVNTGTDKKEPDPDISVDWDRYATPEESLARAERHTHGICGLQAGFPRALDLTRQFRDRIWPLLTAGKITPVVDRVFPITAAGEAHQYVRENRNIGKVILEVRPSAADAALS